MVSRQSFARFATQTWWPILLGPLPFIALFFTGLWKYHSHYEFIPLYLAGLGFIAWQRIKSQPLEPDTNRTVFQISLLLVGFVAIGLGTLAYSPWTAWIGWLLLIPATLPAVATRIWLPIWLAAFLTVPPPFDLDRQISQWMQSTSSRSTGVFLDWMGIYHLRLGNHFEAAGKQFFVEEACSGASSFLTLAAIAVVCSIVTRMSWVSSICSVMSAFLVSLAMNVLRLSIIVVAFAKYGIDLSAGWPHELFGIALFCLGIFAFASCHQWWRFWFDPISQVSGASKTCDPQADLLTRLTRPKINSRINVICRTAAICLIWAIGFVELGIIAKRPAQAFSLQIATSAINLDQYDLPNSIGGWNQIDFSEIQRRKPNSFGAFSRRWSYQASFGQVHFSCDFPFQGDHPLQVCYDTAGWNRAEVRTDSAMPATSDYRENFFRRGLCEQGYLMFNLWDSRGELYDKHSLQNYPSSLQMLSDRLATKYRGNPEGPIQYQFQVFVVSEMPLNPDELKQVRDAYFEVREQIRAKFRSSRSNSPSA